MEWFDFSSAELTAIGLSMKVAFWCALLTLPLAVGVGWLLARREFRGKALLEGFIHLPLVMPPVATGYILLLFFGNKGVVGEFLHDTLGLQLAFSYYAAIMASMAVSFPLATRAIRLAISMVNPGYEQAARVLGATPLQSFWRVTLPLALPGIISGFVLSFARSLGEFGATIIFAGNIEGITQTLPLALFSKIQIPGQEMATLRLLMVSVIISFGAMAVSELLIKRTRQNQ